jgi:hypothetical protein
MNEDSFTFGGEFPPLPSRSTRKIPKKSRGSSRGNSPIDLPANTEDRLRIIQLESKLEERVMWIILANWPLYDLQEQPPALTYRGADGKIGIHIPDFLATLLCGRRIAVAVKPTKKARKPEFIRQLKCIRKSLPKTYADDFLLFTDANFTLAEALNAQRFCTFRRYVSGTDLAELDAEIMRCRFPVAVMPLAERLEGQIAGFRTVFTGIYTGRLRTDRKTLITPQTLLYRGDTK